MAQQFSVLTKSSKNPYKTTDRTKRTEFDFLKKSAQENAEGRTRFFAEWAKRQSHHYPRAKNWKNEIPVWTN